MADTPVRNALTGRVHIHPGDRLPDTGPIQMLCGFELPHVNMAERVNGAARRVCPQCETKAGGR